jgi:hypothetical protein
VLVLRSWAVVRRFWAVVFRVRVNRMSVRRKVRRVWVRAGFIASGVSYRMQKWVRFHKNRKKKVKGL